MPSKSREMKVVVVIFHDRRVQGPHPSHRRTFRRDRLSAANNLFSRRGCRLLVLFSCTFSPCVSWSRSPGHLLLPLLLPLSFLYPCSGLAAAACLSRVGVSVSQPRRRAGIRRRRWERGTNVDCGAAAATAAVAGRRWDTGSATEAAGGAVQRGGATGGVVDTDSGLDPGVGIWTHGLVCLDQLGVLHGLEAELCTS